jgi:uncharacterized protein (TIGR02466 family)
MELLKLFSTPIWIDHLDINPLIITSIKDIQINSDGVFNSNAGGWQSKDFYLKHISDKILHSLITDIQNKINIISKQINPELKMEIDICWININKKGDYNYDHYHPQSALSGVIYIQTTDESNIRFETDSLMKHYPFDIDSELFPSSVEIFPKVGRLIIFPSWLKHGVKQNTSNIERISISFNILQLKESK